MFTLQQLPPQNTTWFEHPKVSRPTNGVALPHWSKPQTDSPSRLPAVNVLSTHDTSHHPDPAEGAASPPVLPPQLISSLSRCSRSPAASIAAAQPSMKLRCAQRRRSAFDRFQTTHNAQPKPKALRLTSSRTQTAVQLTSTEGSAADVHTAVKSSIFSTRPAPPSHSPGGGGGVGGCSPAASAVQKALSLFAASRLRFHDRFVGPYRVRTAGPGRRDHRTAGHSYHPGPARGGAAKPAPRGGRSSA